MKVPTAAWASTPAIEIELQTAMMIYMRHPAACREAAASGSKIAQHIEDQLQVQPVAVKSVDDHWGYEDRYASRPK